LQVIVDNGGLTLQEDSVNNFYRLRSDTFHFSEDEFLLFKKEHTSMSPMQLSRKKTEKEQPDLVIRLQQFDIAGSTPMECMLFLSELKRMLHDQSL
jgi:hypothetical protein